MSWCKKVENEKVIPMRVSFLLNILILLFFTSCCDVKNEVTYRYNNTVIKRVDTCGKTVLYYDHVSDSTPYIWAEYSGIDSDFQGYLKFEEHGKVTLICGDGYFQGANIDTSKFSYRPIDIVYDSLEGPEFYRIRLSTDFEKERNPHTKVIAVYSIAGEVENDTVNIIYDIEGISAEDAEAKVNYVNGKILKSVTHIYGETGQATITYAFEGNKIKVSETKYSYTSRIEDVKSEDDMRLDYKISYFIDFDGKPVGKVPSERIDIFKEFKDVVPFVLPAFK